MDTPTLVSLVSAAVSALATLVLAFLTAWYVRLTHALVQEAKSAKQPNVFVDLEIDSHRVNFIIGNTGSSPALNLRIDVQDSIPWRSLGDNPAGFASLTIVQNGLAYLAPGRTLKYHVGYIGNDSKFFAEGSSVTLRLVFCNDLGVEVVRDLTIDMKSYSDVLYESFIDPEREVARAIRDAEHDRSSDMRLMGMRSNWFKKTCPMCGEKISMSAKKCPHCREFIPEDVGNSGEPGQPVDERKDDAINT